MKKINDISFGNLDNGGANTNLSKIDKMHFEASNDTANGFSSMYRVLSIVLSLLIVVALMRSLLGFQPIYFSSFLESLSQSPTVDITLSMTDLTIVGDWGLFDFLRNFINLFTGVISLLSFFATGLINLVLYLLYFSRFLFGI